jgi:hypothetical protein
MSKPNPACSWRSWLSRWLRSTRRASRRPQLKLNVGADYHSHPLDGSKILERVTLNKILRYVGLFACVLFVSCTVRRYQERKTEPVRDVLKDIEADIRGIIGDASCDGQSDCAMVALHGRGATCFYIAYNRATVDEARLMALVEEYNMMGGIIRKREGLSTITFDPPPPGVICMEGRCTLVPLPDR